MVSTSSSFRSSHAPHTWKARNLQNRTGMSWLGAESEYFCSIQTGISSAPYRKHSENTFGTAKRVLITRVTSVRFGSHGTHFHQYGTRTAFCSVRFTISLEWCSMRQVRLPRTPYTGGNAGQLLK